MEVVPYGSPSSSSVYQWVAPHSLCRLYSDHTPLSNLRWHDAGQGKISFSEAEAALGKKDSVSSIGDVSIGPTYCDKYM